LDAQPAQAASVVRRISSRVCIASSFLRYRAFIVIATLPETAGLDDYSGPVKS
jgi:hypothetical protein